MDTVEEKDLKHPPERLLPLQTAAKHDDNDTSDDESADSDDGRTNTRKGPNLIGWDEEGEDDGDNAEKGDDKDGDDEEDDADDDAGGWIGPGAGELPLKTSSPKRKRKKKSIEDSVSFFTARPSLDLLEQIENDEERDEADEKRDKVSGLAKGRKRSTATEKAIVQRGNKRSKRRKT